MLTTIAKNNATNCNTGIIDTSKAAKFISHTNIALFVELNSIFRM